MSWITIYEISHHTFMDFSVVFTIFVAAMFYTVTVVEYWKPRRIIKWTICAALIILILAVYMADLGVGGLTRKAYYSNSLEYTTIEGKIEKLVDATAIDGGKFKLEGNLYEYEPIVCVRDKYFSDRYNAIEQDGQQIRIMISDEGRYEYTVLKVEMAREDVPADKLDKLMKKYGNDKTDE